MQVNENAPEIIFEWLNEPFQFLNNKQQEEVLLYFTAEEFDEMHQAMAAIENNRQRPSEAMYRVKQELLGEFDKKFNSKSTVRSLFVRIDMWKAAAVFLFLMGSWFAVGFFRPDKFIHPKTVTVTDTVYLDKKFYDTVYVPEMREKKPEKVTRSHVNNTLNEMESLSGNFEVQPETLNVLSLDLLDSEENVQKGNSLRDDSLNSSFHFITL